LIFPLDTYRYARPREAVSAPYWAAPIAMATVVEYTTTTFGIDKLPALISAFSRYKSWETLIPAVFDVSQAEFTAGWHKFLAQQYGLSR
jgi:hypothetical protein